MKKIIVLLVMIIALCGCSTDAETATYNIKQDAEQFKVIPVLFLLITLPVNTFSKQKVTAR